MFLYRHHFQSAAGKTMGKLPLFVLESYGPYVEGSNVSKVSAFNNIFLQDLRKSFMFILARVCVGRTRGVCRQCPVCEIEEAVLFALHALILTCATLVTSTSPASLPEGFEEAGSS